MTQISADLGLLYSPLGREPDLALRPPVVVPALLIANAVWFFICAVWGIRWGLTLTRSVSEGHPEVLHRFGAVNGLDKASRTAVLPFALRVHRRGPQPDTASCAIRCPPTTRY